MSIDGYPSNSLPIAIDAPYSLTATLDPSSCSVYGYPPNMVGYVNDIDYRVFDLYGYQLTPITTAESLENQHYLNGYGTAGKPSNWLQSPLPPATWDAASWEANQVFVDHLFVYSAPPDSMARIPRCQALRPRAWASLMKLRSSGWALQPALREYVSSEASLRSTRTTATPPRSPRQYPVATAPSIEANNESKDD